MSLYGLNVKDIHNSNVVVGMAILCWHNANISWCLGIFVGNTFATTTMISYGTFLSYGALYIPSFGIMKAYATVDPTLKELQNAIGFFLIAWAIFSFFHAFMYYEISHFFICFICIHFFTFFTRYWVLLEHHGLIKAGNVFGILVTAAGLFNALGWGCY